LCLQAGDEHEKTGKEWEREGKERPSNLRHDFWPQKLR